MADNDYILFTGDQIGDDAPQDENRPKVTREGNNITIEIETGLEKKYTPEQLATIRQMTEEALKRVTGMQEFAEKTAALAKSLDNEAAKRIISNTLGQASRQMASIAETTFKSLQEFYPVDIWHTIIETLQRLAETVNMIEQFGVYDIDELERITPIINEELKKPEYKGKDLQQLLLEASNTDSEEHYNSLQLMHTLFENALKQNIPNVQAITIKNWTHPVDKTSHLFYGVNPPKPKLLSNGQMEFLPVAVERHGAKKEITLFYNYLIDEDVFNQLKLKKKFTDFDFFVQAAVANLFEHGNKKVSVTEIFKAMGNTGTPNSSNIKKITDSLQKQLSTTLTLNNREVATAWGFDTFSEYTGPLLPIGIMKDKLTINGRLTNSYIEIYAEPPLMRLARALNQRTTLPKKVIEIDTVDKKTERYYSILNYALTEIGHMKNAKYKRHNKLLYSTMYKDTGQTTSNAQRAAKKFLFAILDHFKKTNYIKGYREEVTESTGEVGVKITLD